MARVEIFADDGHVAGARGARSRDDDRLQAANVRVVCLTRWFAVAVRGESALARRPEQFEIRKRLAHREVAGLAHGLSHGGNAPFRVAQRDGGRFVKPFEYWRSGMRGSTWQSPSRCAEGAGRQDR